jgi:hypothetical protein
MGRGTTDFGSLPAKHSKRREMEIGGMLFTEGKQGNEGAGFGAQVEHEGTEWDF